MAKVTSKSPMLPVRLGAARAGRTLISITLSGVVVVLLAAFASLVTPAARAPRTHIAAPASQTPAGNPQGPFSSAERARISERALAHMRRSPAVKDQRLRVLSLKRLSPEKDATGAAARRPAASAVVFNYSQGNATRLVIDPSSGEVLSEERLRGRPQSSEDEKREAGQIVRADPEHARLLQAGGILEGGFIVDDPRRQSNRDRFIQFHIVTRDRERFQRTVTVNLTTGRIAESRQQQ